MAAQYDGKPWDWATVRELAMKLTVDGIAVEVPAGTNLIEADTKQAMIRSASKVCLLADSSKLGKAALAKVCDWDSIDILVTDSIPRDIGDSLTALGVQVVTE